MNKAKSLEVLRGMKFMQRKEEARRRELFETEHQKQLSERLRIATQGSQEGGALQSSSSQPAAVTIVYDTAFPRESYGFARRSFLRKERVQEVKKTENAEAGERETLSPKARENSYESDEDASRSESNGSEDNVDDPTAVGAEKKSDRFCVVSRAPVLPKRLSKTVKDERRAKRQRDD